MATEVNMELKKAFSELQQKVIETTQKVKLADMQIETNKKTKQRVELTESEIKNLSPDTRTYEGVGRMFILTPIPTITESLSAKKVECAEKIKLLENKKTVLEKSMKESEDNLREMIQQWKSQDSSKEGGGEIPIVLSSLTPN